MNFLQEVSALTRISSYSAPLMLSRPEMNLPQCQKSYWYQKIKKKSSKRFCVLDVGFMEGWGKSMELHQHDNQCPTPPKTPPCIKSDLILNIILIFWIVNLSFLHKSQLQTHWMENEFLEMSSNLRENIPALLRTISQMRENCSSHTCTFTQAVTPVTIRGQQRQM